ncbi:MAG: SUKH-4 family immunity protein [Chloroflexi bacterium]|nr:SUKH-4 family immunity protein [Chloroflexota bacterium]
MITIRDYKDFWQNDLARITLSKQIKEVLAPSAISFLIQYGLPTIDRIYKERRTFLEKTTPLPQIMLHEKSIEENIRRQSPYFEFASSMFSKLVFQGQEYIRIGVEGGCDIAVAVNSGSIHHIDSAPPFEPWPVDLPPPPAQNLFVNSSVEKLALSLTAEFMAKQKSIVPRKKYVDSIESDSMDMQNEAEEEIDRIVNQLENELREIDSLAFEIKNSYWGNYMLYARYPG